VPQLLLLLLLLLLLQIRMDLKHLKTKNQKAAAKHKTETDALQVRACAPRTAAAAAPVCSFCPALWNGQVAVTHQQDPSPTSTTLRSIRTLSP
jgi:hypothetical protein